LRQPSGAARERDALVAGALGAIASSRSFGSASSSVGRGAAGEPNGLSSAIVSESPRNCTSMASTSAILTSNA
jgi:hypothetical protein